MSADGIPSFEDWVARLGVQFDGRPPVLEPWQTTYLEQMFRPDFVILDEIHVHTEAQVRAIAHLSAEADERRARRAVVERFPRYGGWLVEHPRALALLFRLRPKTRPTLVYTTWSTAAIDVR